MIFFFFSVGLMIQKPAKIPRGRAKIPPPNVRLSLL